MNRGGNQSGSILIVSLWVVALLSLLAASVTTRSRFAVRQEEWRDLEAEGTQLVNGLAAAALARLKADADLELDSYADAWGQVFESRASELTQDESRLPQHWTDTVVRIRAIDESGKVNINLAPERLLRAVLNESGDVDNPEALAASIADWRDPDDVGFAERELYAGKEAPYAPANADFLLADELLFVDGVTPHLYFGEDANRNGQLDPI